MSFPAAIAGRNKLSSRYFMKKYLIYALFPAVLLMISSCALIVKPASTKSAKSYYDSFFVGEDGTQYFIKPIKFDSENGAAKLFVDFTFRYRNEIKDSTIINFSVESDYIIKSVDNITFTNAVSALSLNNCISLLFNEKKGDKFISRFSVKCSTKETVDIFNDYHVRINVSTGNSSTLFLSNKKTQKIIHSLNNNLFVLF